MKKNNIRDAKIELNNFYHTYMGDEIIDVVKSGKNFYSEIKAYSDDWTLALWLEYSWIEEKPVIAIALDAPCENFEKIINEQNFVHLYANDTRRIESHIFEGSSVDKIFVQEDAKSGYNYLSLYINPQNPSQSLEKFLNAEEVKAVLNKIAPTEIDEITERIQVILARVGHGKYRDKMFSYWNGQCAVTNCTIKELLRASHAKPWVDCDGAKEKLNPYNGFLLCANLDALFDRGLITFDRDGKIKISKFITKEQQESIGIHPEMRIREGLFSEKHIEFLEWHWKNVWKDKCL